MPHKITIVVEKVQRDCTNGVPDRDLGRGCDRDSGNRDWNI